MEAYINGIGIVSPQKTFDTSDFLSEVVEHNSKLLNAIEPSYKEFLDPNLARRMARVIKMSIAASFICLRDAKIEKPDAIITGTALGCLQDTEKFLLAIIENDEQFLTPTSFIQSTHNTVSAQIALQIKCMNYNFTYVHKGFSFESALLDCMMTLEEGEAKNILVGGHDEMTEKHHRVYNRIGYWKKDDAVDTMQLINSKTPGSVAGEGATFFIMGKDRTENTYAKFQGVEMIYKPENTKEVETKILAFLESKGLTANDIDVVLYGINGDVRFDKLYYAIKDNLLKNSTSGYFKHLCGEYQTSGSFAMWLAARILQTQTIPSALLIGENKSKQIKHVLIYNTFIDSDQSVYLLSQC